MDSTEGLVAKLGRWLPAPLVKWMPGIGWFLAVLGPVFITLIPSAAIWFVLITLLGTALIALAPVVEGEQLKVEIGRLHGEIGNRDKRISDLEDKVDRSKGEQAAAMGFHLLPIADVFLRMAIRPAEAAQELSGLRSMVLSAASDLCSDDRERARSVLFLSDGAEPPTLKAVQAANGPMPARTREFSTLTEEGQAVWDRLKAGEAATYRDLGEEKPPAMSRSARGRPYMTFTSSPVMIGLGPDVQPIGMLNVDRLERGTITDEDATTVSVLAQFYAAGHAIESALHPRRGRGR